MRADEIQDAYRAAISAAPLVLARGRDESVRRDLEGLVSALEVAWSTPSARVIQLAMQFAWERMTWCEQWDGELACCGCARDSALVFLLGMAVGQSAPVIGILEKIAVLAGTPEGVMTEVCLGLGMPREVSG
jgi:hypothetical protein